MAKLPNKTTIDKINNLVTESYPRPHLGASVLGHSCMRYLVYSFYWAYKNKVSGKLNRIFRMGDDIEQLIVNDLRAAGIEVDTGRKPDTGSGVLQIRVTDITGHAGGSLDGEVRKVPEYPNETLLFEGKSANHNNFMDTIRKGVKASKPMHYTQTQMYMGRRGLSNAMYVMMDKNTSDLYVEFIPFDKDHFESMEEREIEVFSAEHINEFPRIASNPTWYTCKFCPASDVCHKGEMVERNCRTCDKSEMREEGKWVCLESQVELLVEAQEAGCGVWEVGEKWI